MSLSVFSLLPYHVSRGGPILCLRHDINRVLMPPSMHQRAAAAAAGGHAVGERGYIYTEQRI